MMEEKTLKTLEYYEVLRAVAEYAASGIAREEVGDLRPANEIGEVERQLLLTEEAYLVRHKYNENPIVEIDNCLPSVEKAVIGATLQAGELLRIARLLRSARIAKASVEKCGDDVVALREVVGFLQIDHSLEEDIGKCIASENEIKDDASPALRNIRRKIAAAHSRIKNKLNDYLRSESKHLQDTLITVREGRFVLPVKAESRSAIPGLVHDVSGSGATVFVEPFPIVDMNNELRSLQAAEREEIEKILAALSGRVSERSESLILCQKRCIMLDIIFAKMSYSIAVSGIRPLLNTEGRLNLLKARHPLIKKDKVVPVSMSLGESFRILVITGPNTGGKTVCLKTAGLLCLMAYTGIFIPCESGSEISVYENIYCDIGDEQSIQQSLSTFSSHMVNLVSITDSVTPSSLVLLDELGGGTDPHEGAALAQGILKYLELIQAKGIVTTHYGELKEYSLLSENYMNASMQFDEKTLKPTYRLIMGVPGVSNALKIAASLGVNDYILKEAERCLHTEKVQFERVLERAEKIKAATEVELEQAQALRQDWEQQRKSLETQRNALAAKLDKINSNAKAETLRLVGAAKEEAEEIIDRMKSLLKESDEAALLEARKLRNRLEDLHYKNETREQIYCRPLPYDEIKPGVQAVVKSLGAVGVIQTMPNKKNEVTVLVGAIKTKVRVDDLGREAEKAIKFVRPKIDRADRASSEEEKRISEIKVLGLTVSEAIEVIDPYLIDISNNNDRILKIVHGKGTGALGKGIQAYLRRNPLVASFRYGHYGEGETGVTFVEMK